MSTRRSHLRAQLVDGLSLPLIAAPMFLVSGPDLVVAAMRAGIIGAFPAPNCRTEADLERWFEQIEAERVAIAAARGVAKKPPYAVNIPVRKEAQEASAAWARLCRRYEVPLVITSVGDPSAIVTAVHDYGGLVLHDVINLRHAEKAAAAGVDGLILVCAGAGGHAGTLSPFAFLPQVRAWFDGLIVLAGAIGTGRAIRAAEVLGADLCYAGTRFIASHEALASDAYKAMLVAEPSANIIYTDAISGLPASFMRTSISAAGLDPDRLPAPAALHRPSLPPGAKPWKTIWSAGQGVGLIDEILPVEAIVERLAADYQAARQEPN